MGGFTVLGVGEQLIRVSYMCDSVLVRVKGYRVTFYQTSFIRVFIYLFIHTVDHISVRLSADTIDLINYSWSFYTFTGDKRRRLGQSA